LGQGQQLRLSASLGVANTAGDPTCPLDTLVQRADAALYRAKAAGRNCVRAAPPPNRAA
jgi:diguanylate cyclase (GGDEF)-like protein